jgi:hypothetical protein
MKKRRIIQPIIWTEWSTAAIMGVGSFWPDGSPSTRNTRMDAIGEPCAIGEVNGSSTKHQLALHMSYLLELTNYQPSD